jgi:cell wall-associated NlpC family hydrolase
MGFLMTYQYNEIFENDTKPKPKRSSDIKDYIGIPYIDRGRNPDEGLDCFGLAIRVCRYCYGYILPTLGHKYASSDDHKEMHKAFVESVDKFKKFDMPQRGDIVVFNMRGLPTHVGIYIGKNSFIHTLKGHNSCVESLSSPLWNKRIEGFYRCP